MSVEERFTDAEISIASDMCDTFQVTFEVNDEGDCLQIDGGVFVQKFRRLDEELALTGSMAYERIVFEVSYEYVESNYPHEPDCASTQSGSCGQYHYLLDAVKKALVVMYEWELSHYIESQIDYDGIFNS